MAIRSLVIGIRTAPSSITSPCSYIVCAPPFRLNLCGFIGQIEGRFNNRLYKLVILESRSTRVVDIVLDTGCETLACW
jgi:hypothetical protein